MKPNDTTLQRDYINLLTANVQADDRILAAWLEGSFGRGNPDRYSDLDVHLLLKQGDAPAFREDAEAWLSSMQPLVLYSLLFDGRMINALTTTGLRLDVWLHVADSVTVASNKVLLLVDKGQHMVFGNTTTTPDVKAVARSLEQQTKEFWRCISLTPCVFGRQELIVGFGGLNVEVNILTAMILDGYGIVRDRGVKNLNQFLPAQVRQELETILALPSLSPESLVRAHLGLAGLMQRYGRLFAEQHGYRYPTELEATVLDYVQRELSSVLT